MLTEGGFGLKRAQAHGAMELGWPCHGFTVGVVVRRGRLEIYWRSEVEVNGLQLIVSVFAAFVSEEKL